VPQPDRPVSQPDRPVSQAERPASEERFRVRSSAAGPVVLVPFIGARWLEHDGRYWGRRIVVTTVAVAVFALSVTLTVLFVRAIARSGTLAHETLAAVYALLALPGLWYGHRWVTRFPAVGSGRRDGALVSTGLLVFVLMPFVAGAALAVLPHLFRAGFPGEPRAAELTTRLRATTHAAEA
jgi:hypothetical protein